MSFFDMFRVNAIKAELAATKKEQDALRDILTETGSMEAHQIRKLITDLGHTKTHLATELQQLNADIAARKKEVIVLDDALLLQSFGLYRPRYDLQNSELYKRKLDQVQARQEELVKSGKAAYCKQEWKVNDSAKEGERMTRDYLKLILRSFNNECDASIANVKFNNFASMEKKIVKAFEMLNKLGARMHMAIVKEYLDLKLEELHLCHEYQLKKQQEKEEQKRIREQMREEARLLREIEEKKAELEKEEKHFHNAIDKLSEQLTRASTDAEKDVIQQELAAIQGKLEEVEQAKKDIDYRERNTRAGYVYVISNLGSFGENVFKIGVTRRLDPVERVDELGDASVPFDFDIHTLVFSEDAPTLENALHKAFEERRLNLVNPRKEYFRTTLEEIEEVIRRNFNKPVEINKLTEAAEYRQSLEMRAVERLEASTGAGFSP